MIASLLKLMPTGLAWRIVKKYFAELIDALAIEPERIAQFLEDIVKESNPGTAVDTQEEWYQQYGIFYNETKSITEQQAETLERFIALGDQDIVYLQDQVEKAGFSDITIIENKLPFGDQNNECGAAECGAAECGGPGILGADWIFYYYVNGTVDVDGDLERLKALLQRLAPGHNIPIFQVNPDDNVCGFAECGEAICDG